MLSGTGKIIAGSSLEQFTKARPYWMVLGCDQGIMEYYRWWIHNSFKDVWGRQIYKTCRPLASCHISMVRGENPSDKGKKLWNSLIGKRLEFSYTPDLQTNGKHWWLLVECPQIYEIRKELGLNPKPRHPLHMTIATNAENCLV
jgi:hypothetical protein